jgi:hypothetical protein
MSEFIMIPAIDDPEVRKRCCLAFNALASAQRGEPEWMGGGGQNFKSGIWNATGIFTWTTEHLGDLTHRMAERYATGTDGVDRTWGFEFCREKLTKLYNLVLSSYGYEREIEEQIKSNFYWRIDENRKKGIVDDRPEDVRFEEWNQRLREGGRLYAQAHSRLTVYNPAQYEAKRACIYLGRMNFAVMKLGLFKLHDWCPTPAEWTHHASLVRLDGEGNPIPYTGPES